MNRFLGLSLAAATLASCGLAAVTPTQTFTLGQTAESFDKSVSFAQFNPILGTLTGIHFTLNGTETGNTTVINTSSKSGTFTYNNQADLFITDVGGGVVYTETLPGTSPTAVIPAGGSTTFSGVTASATADTEFAGVAPGQFFETTNMGNGSPSTVIDSSPFVGTSTVALLFGGDNTSGCPNASCSNSSGTGGGTVSLYYIYSSASGTTIPEPNTMGILGLSLAGLGLFGLRRRSMARGAADRCNNKHQGHESPFFSSIGCAFGRVRPD